MSTCACPRITLRRHLALATGRNGLLAGAAMLLALASGSTEAMAQARGFNQGQGGGFSRSPGPIGGDRITVPTGPVRGGDRVPPQTGGRPRGPGFGSGVGVGIGLGILDGAIRAARPPVYYEEIDEPPPPRRKPRRRPVIVEEFDDEPVVRRRAPRPKLVRQAAPPPPPRQARRVSPPRLPPVIVPPVAERRLVADEVLIELNDPAQLQAVATRHQLTLIASERFELANATIARFRVDGGRSARNALARMAGDPRIASAQPNHVYALQEEDQKALPTTAVQTAPAATDAPDITPPLLPEAPLAADALPRREPKPQYVLARMGIDAAQRLATGARIRIAVIDSGPDPRHPELERAIVERFDALGGEAAPHGHGTAIAGAIAARFSLEGVAPAAEILAARAFSGKVDGSGAEGTSWHVLKSLDWAAAQAARIVNLSFAGPQDRLLGRALEGLRQRGIVAVAAAGNGGPKAATAYPAGEASVIAVTATDADDKAFPQANRGSYVAIAAPGVDILAAAPEGRYEFTSGTSIAAAHVSGVVALMLEREPALKPDAVRAILMETALDLGPKGRDPVFGAGRTNGAAAIVRAGAPLEASR